MRRNKVIQLALVTSYGSNCFKKAFKKERNSSDMGFNLANQIWDVLERYNDTFCRCHIRRTIKIRQNCGY